MLISAVLDVPRLVQRQREEEQLKGKLTAEESKRQVRIRNKIKQMISK